MKNNCVIRKAKIDDAKMIYLIDNEYELDNYSLENVCASLKDKNYYNIIISLNGLDIGYLSARIVGNECELIKVVLKKEYRGCGLGVLLIDDLKRTCKECGVNNIFLEVRVDNLYAKSLYIKNGFVKNGIRKGYYNGIDGEIYWCKINGEKN